jgi:hypothetical protein
MAPVLWDLHYRVLTAQNGLDFVTSDNPVVLFNPLFDPGNETMTRDYAAVGSPVSRARLETVSR